MVQSMGNLKYEACIELSTREGNINMPELPRCDLQCHLLDSYTQIKVPVRFDCTNIVKVFSKTCGSLQLISAANLIVWSSFEPGRFTLYIERASSESTSAQRAAELCT